MDELLANKQAFAALKKYPPKAIVFDWDNTLVDTWPLIQTSIDTTMVSMGKEPWGLEKVRDNVHKSMRESFPEIFGDNWQDAGEIYKKTYRSINLERLELLPSARELIDLITKKGILQFIVSNKIGLTLRKEAEKLKVDKDFFAIIGAQDSAYDKPDKAPLELALMGSDIDPKKDEIWFVGDTIADVECAYNSGCRPIVYGHFSHAISKTIPKDILQNGKNSEGALPVYFDHRELIELLA